MIKRQSNVNVLLWICITCLLTLTGCGTTMEAVMAKCDMTAKYDTYSTCVKKTYAAEGEDNIIDLESDRLMGKINLDQYPKIKERITSEKIQAEAEIEKLQGQITESQDMKQWSNWVKTFRQQMESYRKFKPEQRKEILQKLLTTIDVHLVDDHTHWLEINFKVPLVGDTLAYNDPSQKALGYSLKEGVTSLMVEQVSRPYRKKKPIETRA